MNNGPFQRYVSVLVPVRNEKKHVAACLESILCQDYPAQKMEILVLDGMSQDGTRHILRRYAKRYPRMRLIDNPDKIVPKALNKGIRSSRGDVILRMDAHAIYAPDYIKRCVAYLDKTGADNVGGPMRARGESTLSKAIAYAHHSLFGLGGGKFHDENWEGEADTVYLGCWPRRAFEKAGLFDERLARNQDIEHNARLRKKGGRIFLTPAIKSYYHCRADLKQLWLQNFRNGYWNIKTWNIAPGSLSLRHFIPLLFVVSLSTAWMRPVAWLTVMGSYLLSNVFFSAGIAAARGPRYFFVMPVVFFTLHSSYGLGSLVGVAKKIHESL